MEKKLIKWNCKNSKGLGLKPPEYKLSVKDYQGGFVFYVSK